MALEVSDGVLVQHCQNLIPNALNGPHLIFFSLVKLRYLQEPVIFHDGSTNFGDGHQLNIVATLVRPITLVNATIVKSRQMLNLCTGCFNNGKFGSGMFASDFILMKPAEVPGVSGGKWTDQETILLFRALEIYEENWNEIAEHVATKAKAQCILHFVQMPVEDTFFDCTDDIDARCKETADPIPTLTSLLLQLREHLTLGCF